jgi:hypothetical protein
MYKLFLCCVEFKCFTTLNIEYSFLECDTVHLFLLVDVTFSTDIATLNEGITSK